jgi:hypothetical protein
MNKPNWKVAIRMDGQDNYEMLVEALLVEKVNDYSLSADGIVIRLNDPIDSIEVIVDDSRYVVYCDYQDPIGWCKEYVTGKPSVVKADAVVMTITEAMNLCKALNTSSSSDKYLIEEV